MWLVMCVCYLQLINEFVEKEGISMDGVTQVEVLLGRDTRPSGDSLLVAAKQVLSES